MALRYLNSFNPAEGFPISRNAKTGNLGKPLRSAYEHGFGLGVV